MKKTSVDNVLRMFLARHSVKWENPIIGNELESYFDNPDALAKFGKHGLRFSDERELRKFLTKGSLVSISEEVLAKVENFETSARDVEEKLKDQTYSQSYKEIENKLERGDVLLEAPIVVKFNDGSFWGFSGRKRAYVARRNGASVLYFLVVQPNEGEKVEKVDTKEIKPKSEVAEELFSG